MVVRVQLRRSPSTYDYLTCHNVEVGDLVVVPTGPLGQGDPKAADIDHVLVARVVKVLKTSPKATAWIIGRVDLQVYLEGARTRKLAAANARKPDDEEDFLS